MPPHRLRKEFTNIVTEHIQQEAIFVTMLEDDGMETGSLSGYSFSKCILLES